MYKSVYDIEIDDRDHYLEATRTRSGRPVTTPTMLRCLSPLSREAEATIRQNRQSLHARFAGSVDADRRLLVIVGPCSLDAARMPDGKFAVVEYAERLLELSLRPEIAAKLQIALRCPPAKPRTALGVRGLEQTQLELAYELLVRLAEVGLPITLEVMRELHFRRYAHLLSMAWVGARNVEDTFLRHLVSYYNDLPILFKNSNRPSLDEALCAVKTACVQHLVEIIDDYGMMREVHSEGNTATGVIFRGWSGITPTEFEDVVWGAPQRLVVDCSHANARMFSSDEEGQLMALSYLADLVQADVNIEGVMLESYILGGADRSGSNPGMSQTDPCLSWGQTEETLHQLAELVQVH